MNLLLAVDASQWVLFGVLVLIIILAPIFMGMRNKKEMAKAQEVMDSLKQGDKILTSAGVIGTIVSINEENGYKTVTIETGNGDYKGYMTLDIQAIYMNLSEPVAPEVQPEPVEESVEETLKEQEQEVSEEQPVVEESDETDVSETEEKQETETVEVSEEKQAKSKRNSSKKSKK